MKPIDRYLQWGLFVIVIIGLAVHAWPEGVHNLNGLNLLQCLNEAGMFQVNRFNEARCTDRAVEFVTDGLVLSRDGTGNLSYQPLRTAAGQSGIVNSLERFIKADGTYRRSAGIYAVPQPVGLPEYEYALALQAADIKDWPRSLEHFEQAVVYRPCPWPSSFYERYRETLAHSAPKVLVAIRQEERSTPATSPLIKVGHKFQPAWDVPIAITKGWRLEGLAVRSWTALEHGLPVTMDLFWTGSAVSAMRLTVTTSNIISNGGFELGSSWKKADIVGWYPGKDSDFGQRIVLHNGRFSTSLVVPPGGPEHSPSADTRFIPIERQTNFLLWSAWIYRSNGGNPMIFVLWFNPGKKFLRFEIPFQGNIVSESGRHYAGVIQVPEDAAYMQVKLHNWQASGEALFDDLLLLPLKPPSP